MRFKGFLNSDEYTVSICFFHTNLQSFMIFRYIFVNVLVVSPPVLGAPGALEPPAENLQDRSSQGQGRGTDILCDLTPASESSGAMLHILLPASEYFHAEANISEDDPPTSENLEFGQSPGENGGKGKKKSNKKFDVPVACGIGRCTVSNDTTSETLSQISLKLARFSSV